MAQLAERKPLQILLVEDNAADVRITREALLYAGIVHQLHVVGDGEQALAFLKREGQHADAPTPDLMLLDLSIPRLDGHGVLEALKRILPQRRFPVVVLTGSKLSADLERSYALNADMHVTKPTGVLHYAAELTYAAGLAAAPSSPAP